MQQQVAALTLGVQNLARSRKFYAEGFGWDPVFENDKIAFYQMNGFVFATFIVQALSKDTKQDFSSTSSAITLAHNVSERSQVRPLIKTLLEQGGTELREAGQPPHGGLRGYVGDPDGHIWEIAWNPDWPIDGDGHVNFRPPKH